MSPERSPSTAGLLARFTIAGVVVLAALAGLIAYLAREAGTAQATQSAVQTTSVTARGVVEPRLDAAVVNRDPAALTAFDAAIRRYVLQGSLVRVKVWSADGTILYSDASALIGERYPLSAEEAEALRVQGSVSEVSDLTRPENRLETSFGKLLEVYVGIRAADGRPLLLEAYYRYDAVTQAGQAAWARFAPPSLGALVVLEVVQVPFAWSLARRVRRSQRERERLLQHAVDASDAERRRIARDLHDGIVQDLSGLTFGLDAARLGEPDEARRAEVIADAAGRLRTSVGALRSLLVDIYPPNLAEEGLGPALAELAGGLERMGVAVDLDADDADGLPPAASALLFRTAQEVLRNVVAHSAARAVLVRVTRAGSGAILVIDDDGRGFDGDRLTEQARDGHFGLRAVGDLLAEAGGRLSVRAAPGRGTRVEAEVPLS
ncbi:sensor histidine kinase [Amycolatopsis sp. CA-161197]|uniref:sensor histidine kinase n=1 Tax=Amycolatopsis sp. CA-161197 TaxID=3239922 RepID=UPI003D8DAA43